MIYHDNFMCRTIELIQLNWDLGYYLYLQYDINKYDMHEY